MMNGGGPTASPGEKLDRAADTCPVCLASHALVVELGMGGISLRRLPPLSCHTVNTSLSSISTPPFSGSDRRNQSKY